MAKSITITYLHNYFPTILRLSCISKWTKVWICGSLE
nr:MAG TPA: hypothetical protein [Caudoviricetes sp.]